MILARGSSVNKAPAQAMQRPIPPPPNLIDAGAGEASRPANTSSVVFDPVRNV